MQCTIQYIFVCFHLFLATHAHSPQKSQNTANVLNRLFGKSSAKPVVVYVNLDKDKRTSDFDDLYTSHGHDGLVDDDDYGAVRAEGRHDHLHRNDDAYFLYHLLRNFIDTDDVSSSDEDNLQPTKQVLRAALRARCGQVDECVRECPPKKTYCPQNCQQVFDNLNLCPPKRRPTRDPCSKPKCGRTMPPSWRF